LHAYQRVIFDGSGMGDIALPCVLLFTFGLTGFVIAAAKFRMAEVKIGRS
jgi:hypothetical protein